ncbi:MAG: Hsp20/alpha crystallin family protein [Planctomycetes bacterium]|nr:Hsp20/alpha crystallin family protein [Planctomycetota bacterium]MCH9726591.1 Hsp20/alpha crystallin family protein [Planctomycetota bacterium]MCH9779260.1 Hsp20/alpha crystallin family protein [Planctomycetota bacterium]MCH9792864.1 Hsp20/alpha crystallin family protein [Planctomycetota bacterium]
MLSTHKVGFPFSASLRSELNDAFSQMFGKSVSGLEGAYSPLSVWEEEGKYHVALDVPGMSKEDLSLDIQAGHLILTGERTTEENREYLHHERSYGKFKRVVQLPDWVDPVAINATLDAGVLTVVLNKKLEMQPRKIEIKDLSKSE